MNTMWPLAVITFKEGIRNRALYGISILALLCLVANFVVCSLIMQDVGKVAVDLALSTIAFAGLLVVLFVGINLQAKDLDRKTIYIVLSRPISRAHYIWGKFFGLVLLVLTAVVALGLFALCSIFIIRLAHPLYFPRFAWLPVLLAMVFLAMGLLLLTALSVFFSSFSSSSFITLILTTVSYLVGHSLGDVKALLESPEGMGIEVSNLTVKVVNFAYYIFPNLSLFDLKTQAAHNLTISPAYMFWTTAYAVVYAGLVTCLASLIFGRKEFP